MSAGSQAAFEIALGDYRVTGDADALIAAARAHLDDSRSLEQVLADYQEAPDDDALAVLGTELTFIRQADAICAGSLPGTGHTASAGIGT